MRILHVVATGQRRGAEMFASDLVRALGEVGGFEQEVAVLRGPWPTAVEFEAPVTPMRTDGRRIPGLRMDLATLSSLRRIVPRFRPHVVQAHGGEAFKYATLIPAARRTAIVYRRIGLAPSEVQHGVRRMVHAAMVRRSARIVAVAEAVRRETVATFRAPGGRVVTIPRGIDPDRIEAERARDVVRKELDIPPDAPVVIALGALSPEKNPLGQLDLTARLVPALPDIVCLFAGDGPMRGELAGAVRAGSLEGHVRLLGTRSDVGDLLGASDVLALTSLSEGMPGCVIEAGMAGLPVVAFGVAGVPEVLVDGSTGYIVEPGDGDGLAQRTLELLRSADRRRAMGTQAAERCRRLYNISFVARRYAEIYAEVAAP